MKLRLWWTIDCEEDPLTKDIDIPCLLPVGSVLYLEEDGFKIQRYSYFPGLDVSLCADVECSMINSNIENYIDWGWHYLDNEGNHRRDAERKLIEKFKQNLDTKSQVR
jgi:hypothetical protein